MKATCHCGNVILEAEELPEFIITCNCSICHRIGAQWGLYPPEKVTVRVAREPTVGYSWKEKNLEFHHCPVCGCATHHVTTEKYPHQRVGINCRMVAVSELESVPVRKFDGADTWQFIEG